MTPWKETVRNKRSAVKELYQFLKAHSNRADEIEVEPAFITDIPIDGFRYRVKESMNRGPLSVEETLKLYEAMDNHRNRLLTTVGAETGLRNSEIRELKLSDVDLEELEITARNAKGNKENTVPITDSLAVELRYWIEVKRDAWAIAEHSDYLFVAEHGEKFETNEGLNSIVKSAAEDAGIQGALGEIYLTESQREVMNTERETKVMHKVTAHALRHTFNKVMKKSDIPLDARQHAMNHSDSSVTEEWYEENDVEYDDLIRKLFKFE